MTYSEPAQVKDTAVTNTLGIEGAGPLRRPYYSALGDLRQIQRAAVIKAALAFGQRQQRFQQASLLFAEVEQPPHE
jgi:hypothetical protein